MNYMLALQGWALVRQATASQMAGHPISLTQIFRARNNPFWNGEKSRSGCWRLTGKYELASVYRSAIHYARFGESDGILAGAFERVSRTAQVEGGQYSVGSPPWEAPTRYIYNSPSFHVQEIKTPTLLMEGDLDYVSLENAKFPNPIAFRGRVRFLRHSHLHPIGA